MKAIKLTPRQREIYELLSKTPGGLLRKYVKSSGTVCWRILDAKVNPIMNVSEHLVFSLVNKDVLELDRTKQNYILKADTVETDKLDHSKIGLNAAHGY